MSKITPDSELSFYFDAPDTMESSQGLPPPVPTTYNLNESNPAPKTTARSVPQEEVHNNLDKDTAKRDKPLVHHPSGSEGWLPTEDTPPVKPTSAKTAAGYQLKDPGASASTSRRASTGTSFATSAPSTTSKRSATLAYAGSKRSTRTTEGLLNTGSAFANGPGTTGPYATAKSDEDTLARAHEAQTSLTPKQRSKIANIEAKDNKKLSKIIKEEAKVEKQSLSIAIDELADLQKLQKSVINNIARVAASHSRLLVSFKKTEAAYLNAKIKYETAQAELHTEEEALEKLGTDAREATELMQEKATQVDAMRQMLAADEREREVKLSQLKGSTRKSFWI